jgi:hypothetical protein
MNQLSQVGDFIAEDIAGTHIKVTNMGGHHHLYVRSGADRVGELCGNFPTAQSACMRASYLRNRLLGGATVTQLVDEHTSNQFDVLAEVREVLDGLDARGRSVEEIAAEVKADMTQVRDEIRAEQTAEREAAQQIVADGRGWNTAREEARRIAEQARNAGWDRYTQGRTNQRHSSEPPTPVMLRALALRNQAGEIRVQPGVAKLTLAGLAARGYGRLVKGTSRSRNEIVKLVLNERGTKLAASTQEGAAA